MCPFDDGEQLRQCPMWKTCWRGHKFLVSLDDTPASALVVFMDSSEYPHPMEASKKKARVGPSRTEAMWDAHKVRQIMGVVAPLDQRKPRPAPLQVPSFDVAWDPPQHRALSVVVAAGPGALAGSAALRARRAREAYDLDDEEVDIDAALETMVAIAAETALGMSHA
jgi:hypothetical protein